MEHSEKRQWDEALDRAAEILVNAKRPLLFMGSETSCEAMEVGLHIGEVPWCSGGSNANRMPWANCNGIQEAGRLDHCRPAKSSGAALRFTGKPTPLESMPKAHVAVQRYSHGILDKAWEV